MFVSCLECGGGRGVIWWGEGARQELEGVVWGMRARGGVLLRELL